MLLCIAVFQISAESVDLLCLYKIFNDREAMLLVALHGRAHVVQPPGGQSARPAA